jgi:hypothetical protein
MTKIKIDTALLERAKLAATAGGYSSVEEFVTHLIEQELGRLEDATDDQAAADRLRGLGYIE